MADKITVIPSVRQVYYDTYANLPTAGLTAGDFGYATDRNVLYRWSSTAWEPVTTFSGAGAFGDIPTAADLPDGSLYFATDRGVVYQVQAAAWAAITIYSGSGLAAAIPAAADLPDGSIYYATDTLALQQVQGGAWAAIVNLFDATDPAALTPTSAAATGAATSAARRDHVHGMNGFPNITVGSYTGDGTASRQITLGFKPDIVFISSSEIYSGGFGGIVIIMPNKSVCIRSTGVSNTVDVAIHASDGFVSGSNPDDFINVNTIVYNYLAVKG